MESGNRSPKSPFLSAGGPGYIAPSPRKPSVKEIVLHIRQCRDEITRNVLILQQAALEQERLEASYEQLAVGANTLIEVVEELEEGAVITSEWIKRRDQTTTIIRVIIDEAQQNETQEQ